MDHTVHGILQARILEWVAFPFSRGPSQPRYQAPVSCIAGGFFTNRMSTRNKHELMSLPLKKKTTTNIYSLFIYLAALSLGCGIGIFSCSKISLLLTYTGIQKLWVLVGKAPLGNMGAGQRVCPQYYVTQIIPHAIQLSILFHLCVFCI